jgi:hypothetical protein
MRFINGSANTKSRVNTIEKEQETKKKL